MRYTLYYRGCLKSCNYTCGYCPFAKSSASQSEIKKDEWYLHKFIDFIANCNREIDVFFAPQGEALFYSQYRKAITRLSHLPNVYEVVIQTNLSGCLEWIDKANNNKLTLWTTFHPRQVTAGAFLKQVYQLNKYNIRFTVGMVGVRENFSAIEQMYDLLQQLNGEKPYLWINAYKPDTSRYYADGEVAFLTAYDWLFPRNLTDYNCKGAACHTAERVFFINWNGNIQRCWQDREKLGNLYKDDLDIISISKPCRKEICGCFIGYSHLKKLELRKVYKTSLLGRIP